MKEISYWRGDEALTRCSNNNTEKCVCGGGHVCIYIYMESESWKMDHFKNNENVRGADECRPIKAFLTRFYFLFFDYR